MPATPETDARGFSIDRTHFAIRLERLLDAPPQAVFDAWTRPEELSQWWDPAGAPLARCDIDLRVGGSFSFVPDAHPDMPFSGTYREIDAPSRLVFEAFGALGTVSLHSAGNKTHLRVTIVCSSGEHLEQYIKMGVDVGTAQTLDNLVAFVRPKAA